MQLTTILTMLYLDQVFVTIGPSEFTTRGLFEIIKRVKLSWRQIKQFKRSSH